MAIEGGETFELRVGDCVYFRKGMKVHFDHAKDFNEVAMLIELLNVGKPTVTSYGEIGAAINTLRFMAGAVRTVQRSIST